jgi:hypothetical protein
MPPSGYTKLQADHIHGFLVSCGNSLIKEGKEAGRSPLQSLQNEIANINLLIRSDKFETVEKTLFSLNKDFYEILFMAQPASYDDLDSAIVTAADKARMGFLGVEDRSVLLLPK